MSIFVLCSYELVSFEVVVLNRICQDTLTCPIKKQLPTILNKNLLYTAVTRAKKYVVLVGAKKYISMMIHNNFIVTRNTMLKHFLSKEQAKYDSLYGDILQ